MKRKKEAPSALFRLKSSCSFCFHNHTPQRQSKKIRPVEESIFYGPYTNQLEARNHAEGEQSEVRNHAEGEQSEVS